MTIFGLDISLDHAGLVILDANGKVIDYKFFTSIKKYKDIDPDHCFFLSKKGVDESKDIFRLRRMNEYIEVIRGLMVGKLSTDCYFSIEGYAYKAASTSICQIAELTGYLKKYLFDKGSAIRIHDPLTVKLFATNKGNCLKKDVVEEALRKFKIPEGLIKKRNVKKKDKIIEEYDGPATDLADAYFLARMVYMELMVRGGDIPLKLLTEKERRIFLRVTKMYPVNLLDRLFICKEKGK